MKKLVAITLLISVFYTPAKAQLNTYIRFTDYNGQVLATNGALEPFAEMKGNNFDATSIQFLKVTSFGADIEQSLNLGSSSTGAGVGKINLNPFHFTKSLDALTPTLMMNSSAGTPFKTVEVFFVNSQNIIFAKYLYKLVAIKTMAWTTACPTGCTTPIENDSFEYGGQIITFYKPGFGEGKANQLIGGWNKVKNISDIDPNSSIK